MLYLVILFAILNVITLFFAYKKHLDYKVCLLNLKKKEELEENNKNLIQEVNNLKIIEGEKNSLSKQVEARENAIQDLLQKINSLKEESHNYEKKSELLNQEKEQLEKEKIEWQNEKTRLLKEVSYNIIQENVKNNNELQEKGKKEIETITKSLFTNFSDVLEKVRSLDDSNKKTDSELDLIKRGLLNPNGAGITSETTLYNILKSSNLREKNTKDDIGDYILQTSFNTQNEEENIKRPDCIVYLPHNNYLIIDSKSSMHFLELQKLIDENNLDEIKEIKKKIKDRMNKHLYDLKSKDYQKAQLEYLNLNEASNATIMTIMFLQTEKMMEIVREIDLDFENKCSNQNICLLSPAGLINLLNSAKYAIQKEKQDMNFEKLKDELRKLFDNVGKLFLHSKNLGKGLEKSLIEYNKFAEIFNRNILLRIKNMEKMGIESSKDNFENKKLDSFSFSTNTIDSEAEEIENNLIENKE